MHHDRFLQALAVGLSAVAGYVDALGYLARLPFGLLWCGLLAGATLAASLSPEVGLKGLWVAGAALTALLVGALLMPRRSRNAVSTPEQA